MPFHLLELRDETFSRWGNPAFYERWAFRAAKRTTIAATRCDASGGTAAKHATITAAAG